MFADENSEQEIFEKGLLLSFNEYWAPLGFISVFYLEWARFRILFPQLGAEAHNL